jgi:NAD(P)-dependent dehydrogenase (short-subunit alcohol dehydrogenase family)
MGWLDGTVAIVTGGGSGLGRAIVDRFVGEGAKVAVFDKSAERAQAAASAHGKQAIAVSGDVRSLADNRRLVAETIKTFGRLDTFVGNAGIWDFNKSLYRLSDEEIGGAFDEMFAVNVKGYMFGAKAALEELVKSKGSIVYTVSNAGFFPDGGGPLYTMTKHAVVGLIRQLAFELAPSVRVNGVAPGPIATDIRGAGALGFDNNSIAELSDKLREHAEDYLPRMHMPETKEYTGGYVLFASKENSNMATGCILNSDGGFAVRGGRQAAGGVKLAEKIASRK